MSEELKKFLGGAAGYDPAAAAANARVAEAFAAAGKAPEGARSRVLAALSSPRPSRKRRLLAPAAGLAFAAAAAFLILRPGPEALTAPDWRSYDNFPYYAEEARMMLQEPALAVTPESLIPSAETGL